MALGARRMAGLTGSVKSELDHMAYHEDEVQKLRRYLEYRKFDVIIDCVSHSKKP